MTTGNPTKVLILGGTGMLGHVLFTYLSNCEHLDVFATVRSRKNLSRWFSADLIDRCQDNMDAFDFESIVQAINQVKPQVIINCIGIIKQSPLIDDPFKALTVNSMLPRRLAIICQARDIRLIQISTDCIFDGAKGNYKESDDPNAKDIYGMTKFLGEVSDSHNVTIRTSIIGHELKGNLGLIEWFLAQKDPVRGFTRAIFTGFPTIEFSKILKDFFILNPALQGTYHVSSDPISKYDLLRLVRERYGKEIDLVPYDDFRQDRSLDSSTFRRLSGYMPPSWPILVAEMYQHYVTSPNYKKLGV
jgi:dTDP-4-dehydrorhamnose reductase